MGAKRTYVHFDKRRQGASVFDYQSLLLNGENISSFSFWPFIKMTIELPRYKKDKKVIKGRKIDIKKREVYYSAHSDALIYSWYSFLINETFYKIKLTELGIDDCVLAYRKIPREPFLNKNKCNVHFAGEVFDYIKKYGACAVFVSDITKFFDSLDHEHLKLEWKRLLQLEDHDKLPPAHYAIYKNLTRFKYVEVEHINDLAQVHFKRKKIKVKNGLKIFKVATVDGKKIFNFSSISGLLDKLASNNLIKGNSNKSKFGKGQCGIMQGSPISATLANVYMMSFDKAVNDFVKKNNGLYRRYSDDIVVVCPLKKYDDARKFVETEIENYYLKINPAKTDSTFFLQTENSGLVSYVDMQGSAKKTMQYLGFEFNGEDIYIRSSSLSKYYRSLKRGVNKAVNMAWGKKSRTINVGNKMLLKKLYEKCLYGKRRGFLSYALKAGRDLNNPTIKNQLKGRFSIMSKVVFIKNNIKMQHRAEMLEYQAAKLEYKAQEIKKKYEPQRSEK